tara:strand:- start:48 stop:299 length:252 start_codon:yes stop_codon:yes gene_type:complete
MHRLIEVTQREYDNKWIQWELMDSQRKDGIGHTATWSRYKWVITDVWSELPKEQLKKLKAADPDYKLGRKNNDRNIPVYTFNL